MEEEANFCPFCGSEDIEYLVARDLNHCLDCGKKFELREAE